MVFAVMFAGRPTILEVRYMGRRGASIIQKALRSLDNPDKARVFLNLPDEVTTTLVAFVFLGFADVGYVPDFRKDWYRRSRIRAIRRFGTQFTAKELVSCVPNRDLQFQIKVNIDNCDIIDSKTFPKLDASIGSSSLLGALAQKAHLDNNRITWLA